MNQRLASMQFPSRRELEPRRSSVRTQRQGEKTRHCPLVNVGLIAGQADNRTFIYRIDRLFIQSRRMLAEPAQVSGPCSLAWWTFDEACAYALRPRRAPGRGATRHLHPFG